METAPGLRYNVRKVLEMKYIIDSTRSYEFPYLRTERTSCSLDCHYSRASEESHFFYCDSCDFRKIYRHTVDARASMTPIIPDDVRSGLNHVDNDTELIPLDGSHDNEMWCRSVHGYYSNNAHNTGKLRQKQRQLMRFAM